jgi:hypothetical protein
MRHSTLHSYFLICFFCCGLQLIAFDVRGQQIQEAPGKELSVGIKVAKGNIQYGGSKLFVTDPTSIGMYAGARYDVPVKLSPDLYLDITIQSGFLIYKANVFDTTFIDQGTGELIHQRSRNPNYIPISLGVYTTKPFSVGGEFFIWKGLNCVDLWGVKFLSLGYNGKQFRVAVAGEWYEQLIDRKQDKGVVFSVDFFLKLIRNK